MVALLSLALALLWMGWRVTQGLASLGDVALFYQAFNQGQSLLRTFLVRASEIYPNILFLKSLFDFLKLEPMVKEPQTPKHLPTTIRKGIVFESVSFRYPGGSRDVFQGLNLEIPAGRIVALVGDNGVGKTTIIKLLCRFFDPDEGRITMDGIDIRDLPTKELWRHITVLFQKPVHYHASAAENIAMKDVESGSVKIYVENAAKDAGSHDFIMQLPQGYNTPLGKWFGGTELSVGEWQRVALARALMKRADIVILDEPTSSMDSWAEADWLERFKSVVAGKTALIVTHRFTTAMIADTIHVMRYGRVIESGSHQSLVALGGHYGKSWEKQIKETSRVHKIPDRPAW
jgi:ATP-binding cassette, subfamily B, bacterial